MNFKSIQAIHQKNPKNTYCFLVCLQYKYAKGFLESGRIRFAEPCMWQHIKDITSRGDEMEGVYASMVTGNSECYDFLMSLRPDATSFQKNNLTFFRSEQILKTRAYCMYGLHDFEMPISKVRSQDHKYHHRGVIPFSYFAELYPQWNKENYEGSNDEERPMVLILNPIRFCDLVIGKLKNLGVRDDEIMFKPVNNIDYYGDAFILNPYGQELFWKHITYANQSEFRIVVDTKRLFVKELFDKTDGVIELGTIDESVATLSDFYFDDMQVEIRDNTLLYSLAKPINTEVTPEFIVSLLSQPLRDELPESPLTIDELEARISQCAKWMDQSDDVSYDRTTHSVSLNGVVYNLASTSGAKLLEHYQIYMGDGDLDGAKDAIDKFHHFFPMYNMEHYFEDYYRKITAD